MMLLLKEFPSFCYIALYCVHQFIRCRHDRADILLLHISKRVCSEKCSVEFDRWTSGRGGTPNITAIIGADNVNISVDGRKSVILSKRLTLTW